MRDFVTPVPAGPRAKTYRVIATMAHQIHMSHLLLEPFPSAPQQAESVQQWQRRRARGRVHAAHVSGRRERVLAHEPPAVAPPRQGAQIVQHHAKVRASGEIPRSSLACRGVARQQVGPDPSGTFVPNRSRRVADFAGRPQPLCAREPEPRTPATRRGSSRAR